MGRSGARRQAVILDCCHAAAALPGARRVGPERVHDEASFAIEGYGTEFLAATDKLRLAHEDEGVGSFTDALIEGLEGAAGADDAETITLRDLDDYVRRRLAERIADPTKEMRPIYGCHTETTFALVTKQRRQLALPPDLVEALTHDVLYARLGAVDALLDRVANEPLYAPDAIALIERRLAQDGERDFQVRGRLERARLQLAVALPRASPPPPAAAPADPPPGEPPFGELLQALPRNAADVDRMLLAGLFLQRRAAERAFTTADANRLLLEHGIKLGNPSQSVKQNLVAKRAFAVQRGRYRVAQGGLSHLEQLTGRRLSDS
jgi:hypothetical protein